MSVGTQTNDFRWMIQAGVCALEVLWLQRMEGSPKLTHPVAARRVQEIYRKAAAGLLAAKEQTASLANLVNP